MQVDAIRTGYRTGRLTVVEPTGQRKRGYVVWRCRCDCGKEVHAEAGQLISGSRKSCGCLQAARQMGEEIYDEFLERIETDGSNDGH